MSGNQNISLGLWKEKEHWKKKHNKSHNVVLFYAREIKKIARAIEDIGQKTDETLKEEKRLQDIIQGQQQKLIKNLIEFFGKKEMRKFRSKYYPKKSS